MTDDPRSEVPDEDLGEDPRKDLSIMDLYSVGGRMTDEYSQNDAIEDFLEMHPEANEAEVRAELIGELEAIAERKRQHKARIERERAQKKVT